MPNFCPECGTPIENSDAKFCMECGYQFQLSNIPKKKHETVTQNSINIFELGEKMEEAVEKIFQAKGYDTKRRQRIKGKSGTINEIDILATKSRRKIAIECKNYSTPVGQNLIRDFSTKLREIKIPNGYFATNSDFTSGASKFAQQNNIILWSKENVMEEFWLVNIGRSNQGQEHNLKNALPIKITYEEASILELINKEKVQINSANLFYKPYFVIDYTFKDEYTDPTKEVHQFQDQGLVMVDALDGTIINKMNIIGKLRNIISSNDDAVDLKIKDELQSYDKTKSYRVLSNPFSVNIMEPQITNRFVSKLAIDYIIEKNSGRITYLPKSAETVFDEKVINYTPKRKKIMIKKVNFLYVPKWKIEYQSYDHDYTRELYAYSGTKIEDTIEYCPDHFQIGGLRLVSKKNHAVCEICGKAQCEEHIYKCPTCEKWICAECGIICSSCGRLFCTEHIHNQCSVSKKDVCDECSQTCPICGEIYGSKFSVKCSECEAIVCKNCSKSKGFIRKKEYCINCLR